MPPGRNDPCPCGSGRKYKKCCGDPLKLAAARASTPSPSQFIAGKRDVLHSSLLTFARKRGGAEWIHEAIDTYVHDWGDGIAQDELQVALPWSLFHYSEDESGASMAELMRAEDTRRLTPDLIALLDAEIASYFSVWEVTALEPGIGIQMTDRLTGAERFVSDTTASREVLVLEALLARIIDYDGISTFGAMHPHSLPPFETEFVVTEMRRLCRVRTRPIKPDRLRGPEKQIELLDLWRSMLSEMAEPPTLTNTDGDPMSFVSDRYDFDARNKASIASALINIPGADTPPTDGDVSEIVLTKPDTTSRKSARVTVVARIELHASRMKVETNSIQRADDARALIESVLGALVRYRIREETSATAAMNPDISPVRGSQAPDVEQTPDMLEAVRQLREEYMLQWLDDNIPALGGLTPREAAADPTHHKALDLLLRDVEYRENQLPSAERFDVRRLRTALGR